MRRLLPLAGNEEVLQDGRWLGLLLTIRLQLTLRHRRRHWYGWHSSLGFLGAHSLCRSARVELCWQMLVVQSLLTVVRAGISSYPSLFTFAPQEVQLTMVPGVALLSEASVSPFVSSFS